MNRPAGDAHERSVVILGTGSLQNRLLAKLIEKRTGYPSLVRRPDHLGSLLRAPGRLLLADAAELPLLLPVLHAGGIESAVAIINAEEGLALERIVSAPGVKGVFFSGVSEEQLLKGIAAIFRGDYWLPRRILCAHLERTRSVQRKAGDELVALTRKETETLRLLASGNTTARIAHELHVSPHTVKTHIYNLFRKIGASNRVQALHWATRHRLLGE